MQEKGITQKLTNIFTMGVVILLETWVLYIQFRFMSKYLPPVTFIIEIIVVGFAIFFVWMFLETFFWQAICALCIAFTAVLHLDWLLSGVPYQVWADEHSMALFFSGLMILFSGTNLIISLRKK